MKVTRMALVVTGLFLSGCVALEESRIETARQKNELTNQRTEVDQLSVRMAAMEKQIEDLRARFDSLRTETDAERRTIREQLVAVDRSVKALESSRETDKKAVIDDLTVKIAKLGETLQARSGASGGAAGSQGGREHVVQAGETLSAIAAAYKVRAGALAEANGLKNPDSLRVGQKLIIPE